MATCSRLRWRDYPRERRIVRHRLRLGLLYPNVNPTVRDGESQQRRRARQNSTNRPRPILSPTAQSASCEIGMQIDISHLVLAKARQGQWAAWWEADPGRESRRRVSSSAGATAPTNASPMHSATARLGADLPRRCVTANTGSLGPLAGPSIHFCTADLQPSRPDLRVHSQLSRDLHLSCACRPAFRI